MANVIFEEGTQTQASGFQGGDTLLFKTAAAADVVVTFAPASGLSAATVTLAVGDQSLTFAANAITDPTSTISFFSTGGSLLLGDTSTATGADTLSLSGDDASAAWGLSGVDTINMVGGGAHSAHGGDGADTIAVGATATGAYTIFGDDGDDTVTVDASATGALVISGGLGKDTLAGGVDNDHIYGNVLTPSGTVLDGADSISAGDGGDYVNGNAGKDTIDGGDGSDRLRGGADGDSILGGDGNDDINGNKGADTIDGGNDNDHIRGGADDDSIHGGDDNDILLGDLGADTLAGDAGIDIITGGDGNDVFVFATGDADPFTDSDDNTFYDEITDFTNGADKLDFGAVPAHVLYVTGATYTDVTAAQDAAQLKLTAGAATDVVAVAVGTDTYLFYDSDGTGTTIDSIVKLDAVSDASTITTADFV